MTDSYYIAVLIRGVKNWSTYRPVNLNVARYNYYRYKRKLLRGESSVQDQSRKLVGLIHLWLLVYIRLWSLDEPMAALDLVQCPILSSKFQCILHSYIVLLLIEHTPDNTWPQIDFRRWALITSMEVSSSTRWYECNMRCLVVEAGGLSGLLIGMRDGTSA